MQTFHNPVLIADDHPLSLELLRGTLTSLGYVNITRVKDGKSAVDAFLQEPPDVLFLDINMPGTNGIETLKEIRTHDPDAFVVIVTGESSAANIQESIAAGAQGFVVKPYSPSRIKDVLDKFQKARKQAA